jgi:hypothetical protein
LNELSGRFDSMERLLDKLDRSLERIELVTVVREPNTSMSADAYDGLRKQVVAAVSERMAHLRQLAQFDAAVQAGASSKELEALVREWREQSQLEVVEDMTVLDAFELVGPEAAEGRQLVRPAYVDGVTGRVIRAGILERVEDSPIPTDIFESGDDPDDAEPPAGEELEPTTTDNHEAADEEQSVAPGGPE